MGSYEPMFGTSGSSMIWEWPGSMIHNTYAVLKPDESNYSATYKVYFGDETTGQPIAGYDDATVTLEWTATPEPARAIIYVDANATGSNNGANWADAYNYLQDALDDANSNPDFNEIRVAQGIYKPDQGTGMTAGDRTATFGLINGVCIKGGYAGFGKPCPNARNVQLYETVLSGDIGISGADTDNSYHVVTGSGTDANAVLESFTITAGYADGPDPDERGAGMYNNSGKSTLTNCNFRENFAGSYGGAMYNNNSSPMLTNCTFSENSTVYGGGILNYMSVPTLTHCVLAGNLADELGGGIYNAASSKSMLTNCILWGNFASNGMQIYNDGSSSATVSYSDVHGGWAGAGNINADPYFADSNNGDYHLKSRAGRWNPDSQTWVVDTVTSQCIDAGDPDSTIGNELFPNGGCVNMGTYGTTTEASKSYFGGPHCKKNIPGDINGDCKINFIDFAFMAAHWLEDNR